MLPADRCIPRFAVHRSCVWAVALTIGLGACGRDRNASLDSIAGRHAIAAADRAWAAAAAAHDLEGSVESMAADGIMFPPDQPPVVGRAAIREYMRQAFATPHFSVTWTTDSVVIATSGDQAYSIGRSRYTFPAPTGTAVDTAYGKGVTVWRRDGDGRWRVVVDIWNGAPMLPPIRPLAAGE